jgi:SEC-C motif-containing protein
MKPCPCGTNKNYGQCCGRFISGQQSASTPEELMRSRYTAYTEVNIDYIVRTMKDPANQNFNPEETRHWAQQIQWLQLNVISTSQQNHEGKVEFIAQYSHQNKEYSLHEISLFRLDNKQWFYLDGYDPSTKPQTRTTIKIARNDPCTCGSQKKYKKCCGK